MLVPKAQRAILVLLVSRDRQDLMAQKENLVTKEHKEILVKKEKLVAKVHRAPKGQLAFKDLREM